MIIVKIVMESKLIFEKIYRQVRKISTKGGSAAAAAFGVGVFIFKSAFFKRVNIVDDNSLNKLNAFIIDKYLQGVLFKDMVVVVGVFLETHIVRQPRAATRQNAKPQPKTFLPIFGHHRFNFGNGRWRYTDNGILLCRCIFRDFYIICHVSRILHY